MVVATNPVFPLQAIRERLRWGGFGDTEFTLITSYENMHFCKPRRQYYKEILRMLGRKPAECWMIGNDVGEDLVAGELGISTFLVQDYLIPGRKEPAATRTGYMADLPNFVNKMCIRDRNMTKFRVPPDILAAGPGGGANINSE